MAKGAAKEAQIGNIHGMVTEIFEIKLQKMLAAMKANPEDAEYIGDLKTIQASGKWVEYNEVKSELPTESEDNPLKKALAEVKAFKKPVSPTLSKEA